MLKAFWRPLKALIFSWENSTIASGEVSTILFITVAFFSALNIPFESEQKQKFQITISPPGMSCSQNENPTAYL